MGFANKENKDYVIIGAGIIGLTIAHELKQREPTAKIVILEKELQLGLHSSGRNSGVLHTGIYYQPDSIKAQVCAHGSKLMAEFCDLHSLPIKKYGKIILPLKNSDERQLDILEKRAQLNKVNIEIIDNKQLKEIEPNTVSIIDRALLLPDTAVIDSQQVLHKLSQLLLASGIDIIFDCSYHKIDIKSGVIYSNKGIYNYGHLFNTAGLHADVVASQFGLKHHYTIMPFKGIYYRLDPASSLTINKLLYPVPDLNMPFLGVHFTKSVNGDIYVGPTALPAWSREQYQGFKRFKFFEALGIVYQLASQYLYDKQNFRRFTHAEAGLFLKKSFVSKAKMLVPELKEHHLMPCNKVGIRAQLLDLDSRELVMDFLIKQSHRATHILNAVSPGFTSSFSFAKYVLNNNFKFKEI